MCLTFHYSEDDLTFNAASLMQDLSQPSYLPIRLALQNLFSHSLHSISLIASAEWSENDQQARSPLAWKRQMNLCPNSLAFISRIHQVQSA